MKGEHHNPEADEHLRANMQLDLFTESEEQLVQTILDHTSKLFVIAHKCRGETVFEIALRWDFGTTFDPSPWWILQSTGNRIYPFTIIHEFKPINPLPPPIDHRDFYQAANPTPRTAKSGLRPKPTLDDLL